MVLLRYHRVWCTFLGFYILYIPFVGVFVSPSFDMYLTHTSSYDDIALISLFGLFFNIGTKKFVQEPVNHQRSEILVRAITVEHWLMGLNLIRPINEEMYVAFRFWYSWNFTFTRLNYVFHRCYYPLDLKQWFLVAFPPFFCSHLPSHPTKSSKAGPKQCS